MICDFWQRNEGEIIGTIGAFLIAIFAAIVASHLTKKNLTRKEKDKYNGTLALIHTELGAHYQHLNLLRNSLKELVNASIVTKNFPIEELPLKFDLAIMDFTIFKLYEYQDYHHGIASLLIHYRSLVKGTNSSLEFKHAIAMINDGMEDVESTIKSYFNVLDAEYLDKMEMTVKALKTLIEENISDPKKLVMMEKNEVYKHK